MIQITSVEELDKITQQCEEEMKTKISGALTGGTHLSGSSSSCNARIMPDDLTTWSAIVKASEVATSAEKRLIINKN